MSSVIYSLTTERPYELEVPHSAVVKKPLDRYTFRHRLIPSETQLAYVGMPQLTFDRDISLIPYFQDYQTPTQNSDPSSYRVVHSKILVLDTDNVLISNKAISQGRETIPLFFGMLLPADTEDATAASFDRRDSSFFWTFDKESKVIYCNKTSTWDPILNDYRGVNIEIRTLDGTTKTVLFNSGNAYREAEIADINPVTGEFYPGRTVYTIENTVDGKFRYILNGKGPFYIKEKEGESITVERNREQGITDPWFLKISNGASVRRSDTHTYFYRVTDYRNQSFFPYFPYVTETGRAHMVDKTTISLHDSGVVVEPTKGLHFDLVIRDSSLKIKYLLTTSTQKIGKGYYRWLSSPEEAAGLSWKKLECTYDTANGIVELLNAPAIKSTDVLEVKFCKKQNDYVYSELNLNPRFNRHIEDSSYIIYLKPSVELGRSCSLEAGPGRAVHHIRFEYQIDEDSLEEGETLSFIPIVKDCSDPEFRDAVQNLELSDFWEQYLADRDFSNSYQWMPLSGIFFTQSFDLSKFEISDLRLRSGLKPERLQDIFNRNPSLYSDLVYTEKDIEYPDKMVAIVTVDKEQVLEKDESKWEAALKERLPSTSLHIIKRGGDRPRVSDVRYKEDDLITIKYYSIRTGYAYRLYLLREGASTPDPTLDTLIDDWPGAPYTIPEKEEDIVCSAYPDTIKVYLTVELEDGTDSAPSQIFEVKVRE